MDKTNNNIETNTYTKGLITDLNSSIVSDQIVTHARNALLSTHNGDQLFYTNEPATYKCVTLPYKFNGEIALKDDRYLVFSSNNIDNEIGIANLKTCEYTKLINNKCLGFNNNFIITGRVKVDSEGNEIVIFNDGFGNTRILNLNNIPYKYTLSNDDCNTKIFTDELDCNKLLLFPIIAPPCLTTDKGYGGNLPDGTYAAAIAYSVESIKFSDYYSLTTSPTFINNKNGESSLNITISGLDHNFDEYQLVIIGTVEGVTTAKTVGTYAISQNKITISNWDNPEFKKVELSEFVVTKKNYSSVGTISSNSQYLILADLTRKPQINTQLLTNQIKLQCVVYQYPEDYYKNHGDNIGHYRNESYRYYARYIWNDGEPTEFGHIPNRKPTDIELEIVSGDDVYESYSKIECEKKPRVARWEVENTASKMIADVGPGSLDCGRRIGYCEFGYFQSTELYPDNVEVFGENACKNISMHLYPDESKVPRYYIDPKTKKKYINVLGFRALNIPYPTDSNGKKISGITGYEIVRTNREGSDKRVIARGMLSNMRGYTDKTQGPVLYSNYPANSLSPDPYLSEKQTYKNSVGKEKNYIPLSTVYNDKFNFYSPHGYFFEKYKLGNEFVIETEETATVKGSFQPVYKHPKHTLLTNHSLLVSGLVGVLETFLSYQGQVCVTTHPNQTSTSVLGVTTATPALVFDQVVNTCDTGKSIMPIPKNAANSFVKAKMIATNILKATLNTLSFLGTAAEFANNFLDIVYKFSKNRQFAYQYNSHMSFDKQIPQKSGQKRRNTVTQPFYLQPANHNYNEFIINNFKKETSVFVHLERGIEFPTTKDTTLRTITGFGICNKLTDTVTSRASMFYATNMVKNPNQYGSIGNVKPVKTHSCVLPISGTTNSPDLFGGDCIIYKFSINKKQPIFSQDLGNTEFPDKQAYDYRLYRNLGYPRFWMDTTEYDMGELMNLLGKTPQESALPNQKFNLDCKGNSTKKKQWSVKEQYMYTSVNSVLDFFVEADYNIAFRDNKNEEDNNIYQPHYGTSDLNSIFRADRLYKPEGFTLDSSYKKIVSNEIFGEQILEISDLPLREKNSLIYSLPAFSQQKFNNWQYFLPNNYFSFDEKDFGELTGIHPLDQDRVIFLFSKASPFISIGRDELQTTSGRKLTIGDGGLFAQQPRELMHTDVYYGSSQDKYAFRSTQFGYFYLSRNQGKLFNFTSGLDEYSRNGMHFWCRKYIPLHILNDFPDYELDDNPLNGVGYQIAFDNTYELVYICKRDKRVKDEYKADMTYLKDKNQFRYKGIEISLQDSKYFEDASWTLSYSPANKAFGAFHDWHPDWIIQDENHFFSVKNNSIYKHNDRCDLYCNFYEIDYPYEVAVTKSTGQNINRLRSFEFINEVYTNKNDCRDRFHVYAETFDQAEIYNTEQFSGPLNLEYINGRRPSEIEFTYPKVEQDGSITIVYDKTENKYRFNRFNDLTRDRGKDYDNENQMWITRANGYIRDVNPLYLDLNKAPNQQKEFRHYHNTILLRKRVSGKYQFITKFQNFKLNTSIK